MTNVQKFSKQKGFTLIELMIVIGIIMLLTVIAVGNYAAVQRQVRVGFAADSLVAAIREQQLFAKSGKVVVDDSVPGEVSYKNQCFALKFKAGGDGGMWAGQSDYVGVPKDVQIGAEIDKCVVLGESDWRKRDVFDSGIQLIEVKKIGQTPGPEEIYFKPPFAQVYEKSAGGFQVISGVVFEFTIGTLEDPLNRVKVQYNVASGEVRRVVQS